MQNPQIIITPHRAALPEGRTSTMDCLVRIAPPAVESRQERPPLNLGLVIDRSGSMNGARLNYAIEASKMLIERLQPTDRVSLTTFDTTIDVRVPSTLVSDPKAICRALDSIHAGGGTDLHQGWVEGGIEVSRHLAEGRLNRVIVLSDGHANHGLVEPTAIARNVEQLRDRGVSTSTMGVGDGYNEDLLTDMGRAGDGNFYHIANPQSIPEILEFELSGLAATFGRAVSLGIEPCAGVQILQVYNDLERTDNDRLKLINLVRGRTVEVVLRLQFPAGAEEADLCRFRLAWSDPESEQRTVHNAVLRLPRVAAARMSEFPPALEVEQEVVLQACGQAQKEAVKHIDDRNLGLAKKVVEAALARAQETPPTNELSVQIQNLRRLLQQIQAGNSRSARKSAHSGHYYSSMSLKSGYGDFE